MNLHAQQELFWRAVRSTAPHEIITNAFASEGLLDAHQRIAIYRSMYVTRLRQVLAGCFPEVRARLGQVPFRRALDEYLGQTLSEDPRIEYFGKYLPEFLRTHLHPEWRAVATWAELDWARCKALLVNDPKTLWNMDRLNLATFPHSRIEFVESLTLVTIDANDIRAVWRKGDAAHETKLPAEETLMAKLAQQGHPIAEICNQLHEISHCGAEWIATTLARWAQRAWIADVCVPSDGESQAAAGELA